jgi:hypothetical protein
LKKRVGVYRNGSHRAPDSERDAEFMEIGELLEVLEKTDGSGRYLYDLSIPKQLPGLLEHLRIPR